MKLAFCLFKYFPYGGLQRDFMQILLACQHRGHQIDIYTMSWEGDKPKNCTLYLVPYSGFTNHQRCKIFVKNLHVLLPQKHYDKIIGFNRMPDLDIYYAADVCYEHDFRQRHAFLYRWLPRYKLYSQFEHAVFDPQSKTQILLIAEQEKKQFIKYYHTPFNRFNSLPPNIPADRIPHARRDAIRTEIRQHHSLTDQHHLVLFIGSNYSCKGLDRALIAIRSLPHAVLQNTSFWIIGKDNPKKYQRQVNCWRLENYVQFLGPRDDVPELLCAADLLLHPAYKENAGTVLLEALVAGVPVLTTSICGFAFHIEKAKAGLVIPEPFEQTKLNSALLEMLTSSQRSIWIQNALTYAKIQDLYGCAEQAVNIIERIENGVVI
jgi:UDP-glucose:(heptosyl)LPS alpha-1,3-glucosyltransferase